MEAVKQDGWALDYVDNQTEEIIWIALKKSAYSFRFSVIQTKEMIIYAIQNSENWDDNFLFIKEDNLTEEICLIAVRFEGLLLQFIEKQTYDICLEAVKNNYEALDYIKDANFKESIKKEIDNSNSNNDEEVAFYFKTVFDAKL